MFGLFPSVHRFTSILPFLPLQPASFDKMVYPGLQALAARTLEQGPVVSLLAAFYQTAGIGGHSTCKQRRVKQFKQIFECVYTLYCVSAKYSIKQTLFVKHLLYRLVQFKVLIIILTVESNIFFILLPINILNLAFSFFYYTFISNLYYLCGKFDLFFILCIILITVAAVTYNFPYRDQ